MLLGILNLLLFGLSDDLMGLLTKYNYHSINRKLNGNSVGHYYWFSTLHFRIHIWHIATTDTASFSKLG